MVAVRHLVIGALRAAPMLDTTRKHAVENCRADVAAAEMLASRVDLMGSSTSNSFVTCAKDAGFCV